MLQPAKSTASKRNRDPLENKESCLERPGHQGRFCCNSFWFSKESKFIVSAATDGFMKAGSHYVISYASVWVVSNFRILFNEQPMYLTLSLGLLNYNSNY